MKQTKEEVKKDINEFIRNFIIVLIIFGLIAMTTLSLGLSV